MIGKRHIVSSAIVQACCTELSFVVQECRTGPEHVAVDLNFEVEAEDVGPDLDEPQEAFVYEVMERLALLLASTDQSQCRLIFFGYDGQITERRDTAITKANPIAVAEAARVVWRDKVQHAILLFVVDPQPEELSREGIVMIAVPNMRTLVVC